MTKAARQQIDHALFEGFTPLCDLDAATQDKLAGHAAIEQIAAGNLLFERGDGAQRTYYLLEGEIELCSPLFPTQTVKAGSEGGRYPLAHSSPRQFTAVTVSDVRVLVLPLDISTLVQSEPARAKASPAAKPPPSWESRWLSSPLMRRLSPDNKKALMESLQAITVQAGQVVIHQNEPADSFYVIKKGRCSVSRKPSPSARDVKLAELSSGQGFGEEALITDAPRNASVTMLTDGILLRLGKREFIDLMAKPLLHHLPFKHAIQLVEQGAVLVDVRTPEEFEIDGLIGSLNMPIPVLRLKANRLNRDRTYIVYSNTGQTSSVAVFLMLQQGLNACILEGGLSAAPTYRMKRGGVIDNEPEGRSSAGSSQNTVLPFPHSGASGQGQAAVDWNNLSDDVLWRTTLGYRNDAGIEAALSAKPAQPKAHSGDNTMQGFEEFQLFTSVGSIEDMRLESNEPPQHDGAASVQAANDRPPPNPSAPQRFANPTARGPTPPRPVPQWNKLPRRRGRRLPTIILTLLVLIGGWVGFFYLTNGKLPDNIEAASPLLLEQQRKLDAKVNRLLDAIESMPALRDRIKKDEPAETPAAKAPKPVIRTAPAKTHPPVVKRTPPPPPAEAEPIATPTPEPAAAAPADGPSAPAEAAPAPTVTHQESGADDRGLPPADSTAQSP